MQAHRTLNSLFLAAFLATSLAALPALGQTDPNLEKRGQGNWNNGNRLENLTERLSQLAREQLDEAFQVSSNQGDIDRMFRAQSFSSNADLFQRMARENRSENSLRQGLNYLMRQPYGGSRANEIRQTLQRIQQMLRNYRYPGNGGGNGGGYNGGSQSNSGMLRWSGRVDSDVYIYIQNGTTRTQAMSGQATYGEQASFSNPLPRQSVNLSLNKKNGRGTVQVIQQPTRENGYTAIVRILDNDSGADDYEFELSW